MNTNLLFLLSVPAIIGIAGGAALLVIIVVLLLYLFVFKKKKNKKVDNSAWLIALGEKENIKEIKGIGSRLSVVLVDQNKVDKKQLKGLGVSNILTMSNKITLVIEGEAERIAELLNRSL